MYTTRSLQTRLHSDSNFECSSFFMKVKNIMFFFPSLLWYLQNWYIDVMNAPPGGEACYCTKLQRCECVMFFENENIYFIKEIISFNIEPVGAYRRQSKLRDDPTSSLMVTARWNGSHYPHLFNLHLSLSWQRNYFFMQGASRLGGNNFDWTIKEKIQPHKKMGISSLWFDWRSIRVWWDDQNMVSPITRRWQKAMMTFKWIITLWLAQMNLITYFFEGQVNLQFIHMGFRRFTDYKIVVVDCSEEGSGF